MFDPDVLWLLRNGWKHRLDYYENVKWWHPNLMSERYNRDDADTWMTQDEAVRKQTKVLAGTDRW